jgi:hypothetical protein
LPQFDWHGHSLRRTFCPSNFIMLAWGFPAAIGAAVAGARLPDFDVLPPEGVRTASGVEANGLGM